MLLKSNIISLPSVRILHRITHKLRAPSQNTSIKYLNACRSALGVSEANGNIIPDEIYIALRIEYSSASGKLIEPTEEGELASTILCFMASFVDGKTCVLSMERRA